MERVYDEKTATKIRKEFSRLEDDCYLDHAGATLYSEVQIKNIYNDLCTHLYGNPHSISSCSKNVMDIVDQVRSNILNHFHTNSEEYDIIFTSGATAAIKLLLENFEWDIGNQNGTFVYTMSNHTSIIGGREIAAGKKIPFHCLDLEETFSLLNEQISLNQNKEQSCNSLFAYPAQCNFSGRKYPLEWIWKVQNGALDSFKGSKLNSKWFCLLDAATYCSTNDLNLSLYKPDFICISFYKIFGYPTGLGALLVLKSSSYALEKKYFGGGAVDISLPGQDFSKLRSVLHERFEDGTIPFLSIIALDHGLKTLKRLSLTMSIISEHVFNLARYAYEELKNLRHWNGTCAVEIYADSDFSNIQEQGGIVNFNLKRPDGRYIGFVEVLHIANLNKIHFRTGCFCNTGACQRHLRLTDDDMKLNYQAGHVCGDTKDIINGRPTGSIRISFGYMSTYNDVDKLIKMIEESFVEKIAPTWLLDKPTNYFETDDIYLKKICLFPIKSCGAMEVTEWKLNEKGLEYDREWMIIDENGICLTQKQDPRLSLIMPKINLSTETLTISNRNTEETISIPINSHDSVTYDLCESKVCGDRIKVYDCGDEAAEWLNQVLNMNVRLVRQSNEDGRKYRNKKNESSASLSLSNKAQYLLISQQSVRWLQSRIDHQDDFNPNTLGDRFRGNFLIDGGEEFMENDWNELSIGNVKFRVEGPCTRCQMICIDQHTGEKNRKPLIALSKALNGKLRFGIYLSRTDDEENPVIRVGDSIVTT